jgi:hypothetical protein
MSVAADSAEGVALRDAFWAKASELDTLRSAHAAEGAEKPAIDALIAAKKAYATCLPPRARHFLPRTSIAAPVVSVCPCAPTLCSMCLTARVRACVRVCVCACVCVRGSALGQPVFVNLSLSLSLSPSLSPSLSLPLSSVSGLEVRCILSHLPLLSSSPIFPPSLPACSASPLHHLSFISIYICPDDISGALFCGCGACACTQTASLTTDKPSTRPCRDPVIVHRSSAPQTLSRPPPLPSLTLTHFLKQVQGCSRRKPAV